MDVREHRVITGARVTLSIKDIIAITNTADRLADVVSTRSGIWVESQASDELDTFFELSKQLGEVLSVYYAQEVME